MNSIHEIDPSVRGVFELGAVTNLLSYSWLHTGWTVTDIHRRIVPPIELGQYVIIWHGEFAKAFGSYAWLDDAGHEDMKTSQMDWQRWKWKAGPHLWLIDVIAPWGDGNTVCLELRDRLREAGHAGIKVNFRRRYETGRKRVSEVKL